MRKTLDCLFILSCLVLFVLFSSWLFSDNVHAQNARSGTLPVGGLVTSVAAGGTAQVLFAANTIINYADVQNPSASEILYIDFTGATAVAGSGTAIAIPANNSSYRISGPITTPVSVVAATTAHAIVSVRY